MRFNKAVQLTGWSYPVHPWSAYLVPFWACFSATRWGDAEPWYWQPPPRIGCKAQYVLTGPPSAHSRRKYRGCRQYFFLFPLASQESRSSFLISFACTWGFSARFSDFAYLVDSCLGLAGVGKSSCFPMYQPQGQPFAKRGGKEKWSFHQVIWSC